MGRHHHHLKLPDHLYLSPPANPPTSSPSTTSSSLAASFLSVRSVVYQTSTFYETTATVQAVGDKIPGFKTSAAFLTTLRANINLEPDSTPTSLTNTPDCLRPMNMASSTGSLSSPDPSPLGQTSESEDNALAPRSDPLADIPPLSTKLATSEDDKVDALKLVADSVAQQRQLASQAVLFHPGPIAILVLVLGLVYQYFYRGALSDLAIVGTTSAGVVMTTLVSVRYLTRGYIDEAESVGTWKWLERDRDTTDAIGDEDEMLVSRFGEEAIGALVMRGVRENTSTSGSSSPKKRRQNAPVIGMIRGWAVKYRYRRKGVGTELLEEAIKICQEKGWQGPEFAADHANSVRILPQQFNGGFNKRERNAKEMLERIKEEAGVGVSTRKGKR
jgi:ribosomal protein S18 acetylase RimI-like enzyme